VLKLYFSVHGSLSDLSEKVEVRGYQVGDEAGIVELLELVFQGWPHIDLDCSPLDHWKWKYFGSHIVKRYITVAVSGGEIVGCHHSAAVNVKIRDITRVCTSSFDYAVHPDYRGMGVSNMMGETYSNAWRENDGIFLDYHITGNPILIKSFTKKKPRFPH
jgi:hypothetical protein